MKKKYMVLMILFGTILVGFGLAGVLGVEVAPISPDTIFVLRTWVNPANEKEICFDVNGYSGVSPCFDINLFPLDSRQQNTVLLNWKAKQDIIDGNNWLARTQPKVKTPDELVREQKVRDINVIVGREIRQ